MQRFRTEQFHRAHCGLSYHPQYGLEARKWNVRPLTEQEKNELLQGPPDLRAKQAADFDFVRQTVAEITDPRLGALAEIFLTNGATASGAPQPRAITITRGAAD